MGLLSGIHFLSLVGQQGAGKSTIGKELANQLEVPHIEASAVVRSVVGELPRSRMPESNERTETEPTWLGDAIAREVLEKNDSQYVVLTGVREVEVHNTLRSLGATIFVLWLTAPEQTRFERHRGVKCDTFGEFASHGDNEMRIGLSNVLMEHHWLLDTSRQFPHESVTLIREYLGY